MRKLRLLKRILGFSLVVLSVIMLIMPRDVKADSLNIQVVNKSSFPEFDGATASVEFYDGEVSEGYTVASIEIEDYTIPDETWVSTYYDNYFGIKIRALDASGNEVYGLEKYPKIMLPVPSKFDIPSVGEDKSMFVRSNNAAIDEYTLEFRIVDGKIVLDVFNDQNIF